MIKHANDPTLADVLQPGKNMLAAGYCMYGSSCTVITYLLCTSSVKFIRWLDRCYSLRITGYVKTY